MSNDTDNLLRKVWITRKSRIETSDSLKKKYKFNSFLIVYYSMVITGLSIWNIQTNGINEEFSILILISSIWLSLFSVYVESKNYQKRSFDLKNNYIELSKIISKLKEAKKSSNMNEILKIEKEYNKLLNYFENHTTFSYLRAKIDASDESLSKIEWFQYIYYLLFDLSKKIILIVIPLLPIYYLIK